MHTLAQLLAGDVTRGDADLGGRARAATRDHEDEHTLVENYELHEGRRPAGEQLRELGRRQDRQLALLDSKLRARGIEPGLEDRVFPAQLLALEEERGI